MTSLTPPTPPLSELLAALPDSESESGKSGRESARSDLHELLEALGEKLARRPVPTGRLRRLSLLGGLHARIALAYFFHWVRGWFDSPERRRERLSETHLRAALELIESMGYLRGAVMKAGQTLANFRDLAPAELVETLERLHFEAPPMHYSLIREQLCDELGGDPEEVFEFFEREAFAAASLGQVHRARLKCGREVAVKVQYPGIARTIRSDFRNLEALMLPARLSRDWEVNRAQVRYLRRALENETDYEREARIIERARALFHDEDGIVVPRVHREHTTRKVLTMDLVRGRHVGDFLATGPSQEVRDRFGEKLLRAWYRMFYAGRLSYFDWHPGNFFFMDDGRLGIVDFGGVMDFSDDEWELMRASDRPLTTGRREDRLAFLREFIPGEEPSDEFARLADEYMVFSWSGRWSDEPYDFGDAARLLHGMRLFGEMTRRRFTRAHACSPLLSRFEFAYRTFLLRLGARVPVRRLAEEEIGVTGWPRDYATAGGAAS